MKKKSIVLAAILTLTMSFSCTAWAAESAQEPAPEDEDSKLSALFEEGGPLDKLFGEDGTLSEYIPEGIDVQGVLQAIDEQVTDPDSQLHQTIDGIVEQVTDENGAIDWDQINNLFGSIAENTGSINEEELDALMAGFDKLNEAMKEHLLARNEEFFDPSDVQIFSKQVAYMDDIDQEEVRILAKYCQDNYDIEDDQMVFASGVSEPVLLTLHSEEDGSFTVTDEQYAEDGEGFADSLEKMCETVGITSDDYYSAMVFGACNDVDALIEYMNAHPEITAAEYMGEMKTVDELQAISDAYMDDLYATIDEGIAELDAAAEEEAAAEEGTSASAT